MLLYDGPSERCTTALPGRRLNTFGTLWSESERGSHSEVLTCVFSLQPPSRANLDGPEGASYWAVE